ncbi:hypothetical protein [Planobispora takensis]|uniref:Uncharacterized protein n=1 Tax=Planobispora takensis TaxID=1367882 RepID=A0A8J3WVX3_9ACTN|nr:hypothetical protein [Planobispora takensis]GII04226.1 hypothetical protein Pta02_62340 [Planobispora takensis]
MEEIMLRLNREAATVLRDHLYMVGEHFAAGTPVVQFPREDEERLAKVMCDLDKALGGRGCIACAMGGRSHR